MADVNIAEDRQIYAFIANIPSFYHSADLRNYFSQFIEQGGFDCFHFRHRPEIVRSHQDNADVVCDADAQKSASSLATEQGRPSDRSSSVVSDRSSAVSRRGKRLCCVVRLRQSKFVELVKMYHRKCWLDRKGESIRSFCYVSKIKVADSADASTSGSKFETRKEKKLIPGDRETFTGSDLSSLPELHPPAIMPQGNVGTPTSHFLRLIQQCRLPASIISKLGLVFPRTRSNRKYGSVPLEYGGRVYPGADEGVMDVKSGCGSEIMSEKELENIQQYEASLPPESTADDQQQVQNDSESDADDCEEWERHEAFDNDPSNQERNKERLYESEMEIVWEKGGPGIVWYTDAQFWEELEGPEEEKDVDDWDVDMSVYYESTGGDKDARDMMTMRRETNRRNGRQFSPHDDESFKSAIGKFERHSKGIGRKVMSKFGWSDGQSLGSTVRGIVDALDAEGGQKPGDKRGFGYHGEKLQAFSGVHAAKKPRARRGPDEVFISTVYDDPETTDPTEPLLRRAEPTQLKYRRPSSKRHLHNMKH